MHPFSPHSFSTIFFIQSQSYWSKSIALTCADTDLHCSSGHYYYFILCMRLETCRGLSPKEKSTPSATISPSPYYEVQALQFPLSALGRLIYTSASPLHQVLNSHSIIHLFISSINFAPPNGAKTFNPTILILFQHPSIPHTHNSHTTTTTTSPSSHQTIHKIPLYITTKHGHQNLLRRLMVWTCPRCQLTRNQGGKR